MKERIDFAFYYFLNFYLAQRKASEGDRKMTDPVYQRKETKQMINVNIITRLPTLKSTATIHDLEFKTVFKNQNLEQRMIESKYCVTPQSKKEKMEKSIAPLIRPDIKNKLKQKTDEELKQLDDNEIIEQLTNFTGVMNLWYSLNLQERFENLFYGREFIFI